MNREKLDLRILVRGSNDVASAVAHRLFQVGYGVFIHDDPKPTATRRKMSFTDAIYDGETTLDGVLSKRVGRLSIVRGLLISHEFIPVLVGDLFRLIEKLRPQILVDARMRKHQKPPRQIHLAPLTIGLGPNFVAGVNVRLAVETARGDNLGQVITRGGASPLEGEPIAIDGHARERYLYAPLAGRFCTTHQIGEIVKAGQEIAHIRSTPLCAPIAGLIRGLTHDGALVELRTKVVEIDPRLQNGQISGIGEHPARIAKGVLSAIQNWETNHVH